MRLSEAEVGYIKGEFLRLDPEALVYLFGSRVDDTKRGGDIDLLVLSKHLTLEDKLKARITLYDCLGEQKIDIVLAKSADESAFVIHAIKTGVQL